jgi:hypothetical protein
MNFLPIEVRRMVPSFWTPSEALEMAQMNSNVSRSIFGLTASPPQVILPAGHWRTVPSSPDPGFLPLCGPEIPLVFDAQNTHSVTLKCTWQDQGWGNRKGRLYVVGHDSHAIPPQAQWNFSSGRVLSSAPSVAPHNSQELKMFFTPIVECDTYHLFYKVGGGGGHELLVWNLEAVSVGFGDPVRVV